MLHLSDKVFIATIFVHKMCTIFYMADSSTIQLMSTYIIYPLRIIVIIAVITALLYLLSPHGILRLVLEDGYKNGYKIP